MKSIILWNYSRGTWQYDVFCLLIIGFIFLTPKTWFDNGEKVATRTARSAVKVEDFSKGDNTAKDLKVLAQFDKPLALR
ncbi:MAG: hypothetical protein R2681_09210 [Pyrinomonadaceae bacterium]